MIASGRRIGLVALVAVVLLVPALARAHAELVHSEPAAGAVLEQAPTKVRLTFNEPIEPEFFALEVYSAQAARVDQGDAQIADDDIAALETSLQELAPGTYTVSWRVLSIDGHVVQDTFTFSVGAQQAAAPVPALPQAGPPLVLGAAVRWWSFLLSFALVGGLAFLPLILWPALRRAGIAEELPAARAARGMLWIGWPAIVLLLLLSLVTLVVQAAQVTGLPAGDVLSSRAITRLLTHTRYGTWWLARFAVLLSLLAVVTVLSIEARPGRGRRARYAGLLLGAGLLATYTGSGHASGVAERPWLALLADWLHLVAGTIWIGGLIQLVAGLLPALAALDADERRLLLARAVQRFSLLAGLSVATLIATGVYTGLVHVPGWSALADTAYGAALSGKLILFVPLLLFGAINLLVLHPRFVRAVQERIATRSRALKTPSSRARAATEQQKDDTAGMRLFRFVVLGEIVMATLVLAVTGLLTGLPPATTAPGQARAYTAIQPAGDVRVTLTVDPNQAGENRVVVTLADSAGQPVDGAQVGVLLEHQEMSMGERQVIAEPRGQGRYQTNGNFIDMAGQWIARVRVLRDGVPEATTTFQFTSGAAGDAAASRPSLSPALILVNALTPTAISGLLALLVAALLFVQRRGWRRARDRRHAGWLGVVLVLVGLFATGSALAGAYRATQPNPIPSTAASRAGGQQVYSANCAGCHGATGRGDGPAGFALRPRPADFRVHMAAGHTDAQLYSWIASGVDGTAMPAFGNTLTSEQIWNVINYIRTFAPQASGAAR